MQIVYTSSPLFQPETLAGRALILQMLSGAQKHNAGQGITGHLLITPTQIAQVLEGEAQRVWSLLRRISADNRHENLRLVQSRFRLERNFPRAAMEVSIITGESSLQDSSGRRMLPDLFELSGPEIIETAAIWADGLW